MARVLYLVHRIPFPPNKGDKIRSYHLLKALVARHEVTVAAFVDDPADWQHQAALKQLCAKVILLPLNPRTAKLKSLTGLVTGEALTLPYYRSRKLAAALRAEAASKPFDATVVYSSALAPYAFDITPHAVVTDFVDVDSAKWSAYADDHRGPMAWLYRREGRALARFERDASTRSVGSFFATRQEAELFTQTVAAAGTHVDFYQNGVDTEYFRPQPQASSPYTAGARVAVFTGAMDYWPNIEAVKWFADNVWADVRARFHDAEFYIVGMRPAAEVIALGKLPGITVTGSVPDVRPYVQHARVAVVPIRIARGVQNKAIEAMAMAKPIVISEICSRGIDALADEHMLVARDARQFTDHVLSAMEQDMSALSARARARIVEAYSWEQNLQPVLRAIDSAIALQSRPAEATRPALAA